MPETEKTHEKKETVHAADKHISARRKTLNDRLLGWGKFFLGGLAIALAGELLFPFYAPLGIAVRVAGDITGSIGLLGIIGNVAKRLRKQNR